MLTKLAHTKFSNYIIVNQLNQYISQIYRVLNLANKPKPSIPLNYVSLRYNMTDMSTLIQTAQNKISMSPWVINQNQEFIIYIIYYELLTKLGSIMYQLPAIELTVKFRQKNVLLNEKTL